ncbi:MAG: 30S ribosomal protein S12 methylthiotransferase RimO [Flavobacteriales bacterium]|nr:30S ribosomal protein S12 methylthiotransferase RimO [Flavobacteriales bacterium]
MKTKTLKKNKVNVITLGCSKNIYDSEVLMGQLKNNKFDVVHESNDDDISTVIINTCGFIETAKQESIDTILQYAQGKKDGLIEKLYVTGCLSERYRDDLRKENLGVDGFFGTKDLPRLLKTLKADYKKELLGERLLTTPAHFAFFKISEGCDRPCSFCAIPIMRGKHESVPIEELVSRAESLANNGTKELILIAQDLTYYGLDIYKKRNLAELLNKLSDVKGIEWIRLHYAFPTGFPEDILEVIKEKSNICNYLDIPLQHISDNILASMRRGTTKKKTTDLLIKIKESVPGITVRTTLITGYPGETEENFQEMLAWVKEMKFDRLGVFPYSHEDDTHAFKLEDDVPEEVKQSRADEIMDAQSEISLELNELKIGKTFKVLIDRKEEEVYIGRTECDSPDVDNEVLIENTAQNLIVGNFYQVKIDSAEHYDLFGHVVE